MSATRLLLSIVLASWAVSFCFCEPGAEVPPRILRSNRGASSVDHPSAAPTNHPRPTNRRHSKQSEPSKPRNNHSKPNTRSDRNKPRSETSAQRPSASKPRPNKRPKENRHEDDSKPSKSGGYSESTKGSKPSDHHEGGNPTASPVNQGSVGSVPTASPVDPVQEGDLNIRFNKIPYPNGVPESLQLPLTMEDYPLTAETAAVLRTQTLADAVVLEDDGDMRGKDPSRYVDALGGLPPFPNKDPNNPYWDDLEEVVDYQILRTTNGTVPFTLPMLWEGYNLSAMADAVHNKYPGGPQANLLSWLYKDGLEVDYNVMPFRSTKDIVSLQFRFAYLNTWAIECVAAINFCIKWSYGFPRPEEVAYQIATGELKEGVPDDLKAKIMSMNLENATSFTAYPEGSPCHPSWPAMHSAMSAASFWLSVATNLTPEQYCEALRVDYAVAFARTVAGVHYRQDNLMGLNLGQRILADRMPDHFAESFGSDPVAVQEKIDRMQFDWNDFNVDECSIAGVPIVVR